MARKASSLILFSVIFLVIAWIGPVGPALAAPQTAPRSAADLSLLGDWVNANPAIYYFVKSGSGFTGQIKGQTECPADLSEQATSTPGYYTGTEPTYNFIGRSCQVNGTTTNTIQIAADGATASYETACCGNFAWSRAETPAFTADSPPSPAEIYVNYAYTFTARGVPSPTFSRSSGALPPGLSLKSDGLLSGTPVKTGEYKFSVKAANGVSPDAIASITIKIVADGVCHSDPADGGTSPSEVGTDVTDSDNWAGYTAESSACSFTRVTGEWIQPAVTCPDKNGGDVLEADFWVGLDGGYSDGRSGTVEQTGIEATCTWGVFGYHLKYSAWYEMVPAYPVDFPEKDGLDPEAGSTVKATVTYDGDNQYDLNLVVTTHGDRRTGDIEEQCKNVCQNSTAEWIAEKVANSNLAPFKLWTLTDGYATTSVTARKSIESLKPEADQIEPEKTILAYPRDLNGSTMKVVWVHI